MREIRKGRSWGYPPPFPLILFGFYIPFMFFLYHYLVRLFRFGVTVSCNFLTVFYRETLRIPLKIGGTNPQRLIPAGKIRQLNASILSRYKALPLASKLEGYGLQAEIQRCLWWYKSALLVSG